ncbi:MAG: spore cortex biosynthesis protein YabQ [Oscillibacter sp.]|nr:spore cortex biosynthesis protein YabQ [Oscillibacter sp.]
MENYISQQLLCFGASVLLGLLGGLIYDLLRAVRIRKKEDRVLTHLLDGVYTLFCLLCLLWFALRIGEGELRLYMVGGILIGAVFYFGALSGLLRPLWDFWVDAAAYVLHLLWLPLHFLFITCKKWGIFFKKLFQFFKKYATIFTYQWQFILIRQHSTSKGGRGTHEKRKQKKQKEKKQT